MKWLKLYTEILDDPKIRILAFEDRWHYVALLCCKAEGLQDEREGIWERLLRVKLGLAEVEFDSLKKRLLEVCLIDESWNPSGWDKRQGAEDKKAADRQRKYREKLKKRNVTDNVTPTSQVEVEVERELKDMSDKSDDSREVFDYWVRVMGKNPAMVKFSTERRSKIRQRLKEFSVEDIKRGIDGCRQSDHHMGKNDSNTKYNDIELICRNASKLEGFIERATRSVTANPRDPQSFLKEVSR